ncbi:hypothetical protein K458DRAFT_419444 [Lentithecium fluviatile CBS 122367]|uniref:Integral membrane protein n=1 Tax=Lentithecium fluviatile CBS 122367 TaxID=1168545 RepID=A0A6G1IX96_9PLEO|nr:hypothetical protein K458DRAFT_419444 [Lentithecium fluviatile CBS 122367]
MSDAGDRDGRRTRTTHTTSTTTHGPTTTTTSSTTAGPLTTVTTSGPQSTTVHHPNVTTTTHQTPTPRVSSASTSNQPERPSIPSIRIRRQGADESTLSHAITTEDDSAFHGRRRSSSEPQRPQPALLLQPFDDLEIRRQLTATPLQTLHEEDSGNTVPRLASFAPVIHSRSAQRPAISRQASAFSLRGTQGRGPKREVREYDTDMIDMLDVIDPEVSTLTTLNNVQNSLFIPNLGWLYNRRPTYDLTQSASSSDEEAAAEQDFAEEEKEDFEPAVDGTGHLRPSANRLTTTNTISSVLTGVSEGHNYAVLPHGASLPGWTAEEKAMLNDHVRHLLHSRRARFKRSMRGFGRYVRKPLGFLVTLYAFLLTFWGAAWVLFLIGWISVEGRQAYFIEICDQILTALFCVVGIGLAPWRAIDTYHMIYVAKYAHKTWRLRKERGLPDLRDHNELPTREDGHAWEVGEDPDCDEEEPVLTAAEQQKLEHHQNKLATSHTFYKPHETTTHAAFSIHLLIAIVVLLDCHSLFQMALGGTTWGIYYKDRPKELTAVILSCSISCNISAGITISVGDRKSRKKLVLEQIFRQGVTEEALHALREEKGLVASGIGRKESKKKKGKK